MLSGTCNLCMKNTACCSDAPPGRFVCCASNGRMTVPLSDTPGASDAYFGVSAKIIDRDIDLEAPILIDDIRSIVGRLRARDRLELSEYGIDDDAAAQAFAAPAALARLFFHGGLPTAIVTFHPLTPRAVVASMFATDDWPFVARAMVRWSVCAARPALLAQGFARAECRTMEGHAPAIRLLERLGFVCECRLPDFGAHGASFLQYAWRLNDHVPFQITEGSAAATPAADA